MIRSILIIDDHEDSLFILKQLLLKNGIAQHVATCRNGWEGIDYLNKSLSQYNGTTPDLILLDMDSPATKGSKFLDEYRKRFHYQLPQTSLCITSSLAYRPKPDDITSHNISITYVDKLSLFRNIKLLVNVDALRARIADACQSLQQKENSAWSTNGFAADTLYPGAVQALHKGLW